MKKHYKFAILMPACAFAFWILLPAISGSLCFSGLIQDQNFCSIVGINFFGHSVITNPFAGRYSQILAMA